MLGKLFFADFCFSPVRKSRFSPIFDFPPWGKADFCRFLIFPREGKPIFVDFRSSYTPTKASFSRFLLVVPLRKPLFAVFRSSYPYESFFFPFFINCTPYLSDFSRKSMICARIWVVFLIEQFSGRAGCCWSKAWKSLTFIYFNISTKLLLAQLPKML